MPGAPHTGGSPPRRAHSFQKKEKMKKDDSPIEKNFRALIIRLWGNLFFGVASSVDEQVTFFIASHGNNEESVAIVLLDDVLEFEPYVVLYKQAG